MRNTLVCGLLSATCHILLLTSASAEWQVENEGSIVHYVTTKKQHVAEVHSIANVSGRLSGSGELAVEIGMEDVSSGVDVRDARLRDILFKVVDFPKATFEANLDISEYQDLSVGQSMEGFVEGTLSLVGLSTELDFSVRVTRVSDKRVIVVSDGPIILDATALGLSSAVDKLRELAKLPSISYGVPVSLLVTLVKK